MPTYDLLITDVTKYSDKFCVAGWDLTRHKMIRPEPSTARLDSESSRFWTAQDAGPGKALAVGHVVRLDAAKPNPHFGFPHATEDRVMAVGSTPVLLGVTQLNQVPAGAAASVASTVEEAFGGGLQLNGNCKAFVAAGYQGPSLGAVQLPPKAIYLHEETYGQKTKLRAMINDGTHTYDLSVPAEAAVTRWKQGGIGQIRQDVASCAMIHVRLGLARAWADNPCYAQVNGLYLL